MTLRHLPHAAALLTLGALLIPHPAVTAPTDLDLTFGKKGKVSTDLGKGESYANDVVVLSDGKIVAGGTGRLKGRFASDFALARYTADGKIDKTFGTKGVLITPVGTQGQISALALQTDGKLVAAGVADVGNVTQIAVARYNADGTLDPTFSGDGIVTTPAGDTAALAYDVAIDGNGNIVVVGIADTGGDFDVATARYTSAGALDTTFSDDGIDVLQLGPADDFGKSVAIQSDNKIVVGGSTWVSPASNMALIRYNTDGTPDATFGGGDGIVSVPFRESGHINSIAIYSDGVQEKIVAAGLGITNQAGFLDQDFLVARFDALGSLDTGFGTNGVTVTPINASNDIGNKVLVEQDGRVIVAGYTQLTDGADFAVVRYTSGGEIDSTFATGIQTTNFAGKGRNNSIDLGAGAARQANGAIVVAGQTTAGSSQKNPKDRFALARYEP